MGMDPNQIFSVLFLQSSPQSKEGLNTKTKPRSNPNPKEALTK